MNIHWNTKSGHEDFWKRLEGKEFGGRMETVVEISKIHEMSGSGYRWKLLLQVFQQKPPDTTSVKIEHVKILIVVIMVMIGDN